MDKLFSNVFKNKKIFLTGHTGFIGSWLSIWLTTLGANVIGYSIKPPSNPSMFDILGIKKSIIHIHGDVNNEKLLERKILEHKPTFLFHLAAQSLVKNSYKNTKDTFQTNVMGTVNILEIVKHVKFIKNVIIMTSDKSYENYEKNKFYKEGDPLGGNDPYSASKGATEIITNSYRKSFFQNDKKLKIGLSTIRAGNVIGGGDWAKNRIIPDCIRALKSKKPIHVRNPDSTRPFQFVLEPISAMLWVSANMNKDPKSFSTAWNVGPDKKFGEIKVKTLVPKIIKEWKSGTWMVEVDKTQKKHHESKTLMLDSSKIKNLLKWYPTLSINEAIKNTTDWYKTYYEKSEDIEEFTLKQIEEYVKKAKELNIVWSKI
jgi:CDP-glucose 4,6-dehydratase